MSQDGGTLEEQIQKAIVDRDKLKYLEQRNAELKRLNGIYSKTFAEIRTELGDVYDNINAIINKIQDLEDIE